MSFTPATAAALAAVGLDPGATDRLVQLALAEDLADGVDVTSLATVPFDLEGVANFTSRAPGIVAGLPVVRAVLEVGASKVHPVKVVGRLQDDENRANHGDHEDGQCFQVARPSARLRPTRPRSLQGAGRPGTNRPARRTALDQ